MKPVEYAILTVFMMMVVLGALVVLMLPHESNKEKYASDSAKLVVSTMEPIYGSVNGGDQIVIKGENIASESGVLFGENIATKVSVSPDHKQLVATSPLAATSGGVPVIVFGGNYQAQLPMMFFYTK